MSTHSADALSQKQVDAILSSVEKEFISNISAQLGSMSSLILDRAVSQENQATLQQNQMLYDFSLFVNRVRQSIPQKFKIDPIDLRDGSLNPQVFRDMLFGDFGETGLIANAFSNFEATFEAAVQNEKQQGNPLVQSFESQFREHLTSVSIGLGLTWDDMREEYIKEWTGEKEHDIKDRFDALVEDESHEKNDDNLSHEHVDSVLGRLRIQALLYAKDNVQDKTIQKFGIHDFGEWLVFVKVIDNEHERTAFTRVVDHVSVNESLSNIKSIISRLDLPEKSKPRIDFLEMLNKTQAEWEASQTSNVTNVYMMS